MNWFYIAIFAPILWSISNHIDKYLLSKYLKVGNVGALAIFSFLVSIVFIPIIFIIEPSVLNITIREVLVLVSGGIISSVAIILYLYAMDGDEATIVTPFFQLIPIFLFLFGYIILGETLTSNQIISGLIIIFGAMILSIDINTESGYKIKKKLVLLMIGSSILYALYETMFKYVAIQQNFWVSNFWQYLGVLLSGIVLLISVKKYRDGFIDMFKNNGKKIFFVNFTNEVVYTLGSVIFVFSTLLAPIALVGLVNAYQPMFVFLGAIVLTTFIPKISKEKIRGAHLAQKILAIIIIFIGSYFINI